MLQIPEDVAERFESALQGARIADPLRPHLRKWLRYYLDFCTKYGFDPADEASFPPFSAKLREKGQAEWKRRQAFQAIRLHRRTISETGLHDQKLNGRSVPSSQDFGSKEVARSGRGGGREKCQGEKKQGGSYSTRTLNNDTSVDGYGREKPPASGRHGAAPSTAKTTHRKGPSGGLDEWQTRTMDSQPDRQPSGPKNNVAWMKLREIQDALRDRRCVSPRIPLPLNPGYGYRSVLAVSTDSNPRQSNPAPQRPLSDADPRKQIAPDDIRAHCRYARRPMLARHRSPGRLRYVPEPMASDHRCPHRPDH